MYIITILSGLNQSINQNLFMTKTYIQLNLGIKHKQIVHILTVVYLKVLLEGCRKFEFQFYFIDFSQTYLCWLTYIEISGSMKK